MDEANATSEYCLTYAVVNIQHKRKKAADKVVNKSESIDELYAVVDKNKKKEVPDDVQESYNNNKDFELKPTTIMTKMSDSSPIKREGEFRKRKSEVFTKLGLLTLIIFLSLLSLISIICAGVCYEIISSLKSESFLYEQSMNRLQLEVKLLQNTTNTNTQLNELLQNIIPNIKSEFDQQLQNTTLDIITEFQEQLQNMGKSYAFPAPSCWVIRLFQPSSSSGYYWVTSSNGTSVEVYCEMTKSCGNITGGLTRIALVNNENRQQICTGGFSVNMNNTGCTTNRSNCVSLIIPVKMISFSHVCGLIEGYFTGLPDGFSGGSRSANSSVNNNYVDGISLTYGDAPNRTHIWTFIGDEEVMNPRCPRNVPEFVGQSYSCLKWNGICTRHSESCSYRFFRHLQHSVTEDIEVRLCRDDAASNEHITFGNMEIYIF